MVELCGDRSPGATSRRSAAGVGRGSRRAVRQPDEEEDEDDEAPASAFDRLESDFEPESGPDEEESFESFEDDEPLDDAAEVSVFSVSFFSLRRPLALAPWSFL